MPPKRPTALNKDDILARRIEKLERRVNLLTNNKILTAPLYDSANLPVQGVEGQIAIGDDEVPYIFINGAWVQVGGSGGPGASEYSTYAGVGYVSCAVGASTLSWGTQSGDTLLDMTDPVFPEVVATGVYTVEVVLNSQSYVVGRSAWFRLAAGTKESVSMATAGTSLNFTYGSLSVTAPLTAGDVLSATIENQSGATQNFRFLAGRLLKYPFS